MGNFPTVNYGLNTITKTVKSMDYKDGKLTSRKEWDRDGNPK